MANKFLDSIRQQLTQAAPTTPVPNQTEQAQSLLQAKSGKAVAPSTTPRISNIGEQLANQQTQAGVQEQTKANVQQAQNLGTQQQAQDQEINFRLRNADEQFAKSMDEYLNRSQAALDEYKQGTRQLDLSKDKARLEQLGFTMRLASDKYVDNLQRIGAQNRLDNELNFNEALARSIFADEQDMFEKDLKFRAMLGEDSRDFNQELGNIDLDFAMSMANAENKANNARTMWSGIGGLGSAGIQGYTAYKRGDFNTEPEES